jgi:RHS repeat-associated protein
MQFKRTICMGSIYVILKVLSSLSPGGDAMGQVPLTIDYSSPSMSRGGSQNLSTLVSLHTGITDYLYDETENLIQRLDTKEAVVNYTYDALNRLTAIQFPSDPDQNVTFTYDSTSVTYGMGRLTGRIDPSGSFTFYYDANGNLTREDKTIGGILYTTQYTYNNNNILTSITYPTGRTITYVPDVVDKISIRQVSTTLNGNPKILASAITYLPYEGIGLTYGNGLSSTQGYNDQCRISSIVTGSILNLTYGDDPNGNITSFLDEINLSGGEMLENPEGFPYQQGTNKLAHVEGTPPFDYGYDAKGNITTEKTWTYVFDLSNQLIRVLDGTNQIAQYTYNGAGQRIKKVTQTETRIFHYDLLGHLVAETNQNGQMLAEYVYLGEQLLAMIKPGESVYYFHNDYLGTPQILTDDSGSIAWKATYTVLGGTNILTEIIKNPHRFMGQYYDPETGLHYNYHRYYDPATGKYITPNPIRLRGGINSFVGVKNKPINEVDLDGLEVQICARQSWPGIFGGKNSKFYVVPHCYLVVNGVSYSWHMESHGGITHDEHPSKNSCSTLKCCSERQAEFDRCVKQAAEADIGHEGNAFFPVIHDCCTWSNGIIDKCRNKTCAYCKE